jgi:hypothetical protein
MGKSVLAVRSGLFSMAFLLLTAPCFAKQQGIPPLGRDFVITSIVTILFIIILSIKTKGFVWPLFAGLRQQARLLSAAHVVLFLACFLFCANMVVEKSRLSREDKMATNAVAADAMSGPGSSAGFPSDAISKTESFSRKMALPLFIIGMILLLPGIHAQRKMDPEKYMYRALRNSLRSMAWGFLLIPGYMVVFYLTLALTAFIHD